MKNSAFHAAKAMGITALSSIVVLAGLLLAVQSQAFATGVPPVQLGTAGNYSVLGGTGVTNTGTTTLNADLGAGPSYLITGFGSPSVVDGQIDAGDTAAVQAQSDLATAYSSAAALTSTALFSGDQVGKTLAPGVYYAGAAIANSGIMTLDGGGDPNAVFVFQVNGALNPAANSAVVLTDGAQASNVFWQVNGAVTIGASSSFSGNIMAEGAITVGLGSSIDGRALAAGAVTLATNNITTPDIVNFTSPTPTSALTSTAFDSVLATGTPGDSGSISYVSTTGSVCTVNSTNGALSFLGVGTCTIEATQAADSGDSYTSATADTSFPVTANPAYVVSFNGNGSTSGATAPETDNVPSALTLNGFVRTGYTFSGWNTVAIGTGTSYADGATYPFGAATTLYAQWTANPAYVVSFNGNGSTSGATAPETDNVPSALTLNGFVRTGYTFSGWNTVAIGTGTSYADGATYPFGAATTLYAQWTASGGGGGSATAAPVITGISPARGSTAGGTRVSITGSNFGGATIVKFGAVTAIDVIVVNSSTITAASPAGTAGLVNVTVTTPGGTSSASFADDFTYVSAVSVTLIQGSPSSAIVADGGGYSGQRAVTNGTGTISYSETTSGDSSYVVVTSTGAISAATSLSPGTYSVSGNDSDTNGDTGSWTFSLTVIIPPTPAGTASYDLVGSDGGVFVFGQPGAGFFGSLPGIGVHVNDIVGMVSTSGNKGYYLVGSDGGVFAFGDATFEGSLPGIGVDVNDIVGISPTADDGGYFLVGKDGGVFSFGNASFEGSLPGLGIHVNNIVGFAATTTDQGYWVVGSGGRVYAFGNAANLGSAPGAVTSIASAPGGQGYWLTGPDGGVFTFGSAPFEGSLPGMDVKVNNITAMVPSSDGKGYVLIGADGGIFAFGDASFEGSLPGIGIHVTNIVGAVPTAIGLSQ
jgi:uncharacterized repeat protein (TIGR02543 family)